MKEHEQIPLPDFVERTPEEMRSRARDFYDALRRRHTVRMFSDRPVSRDVIECCIRTAATAPSGANHQPWFFAAIGDQAVKHQVRLRAEAEENAFYGGKAGSEWLDALSPLGTDEHKPYLEIAPWLIAIFAQRRGGLTGREDRKNYYVPESCGIATGFLIAALHHAGLATLTHTPKPMDFLNSLCGRPESERPFILLVTGYPAPDATVPVHAITKKAFEDVATFF